MIEIFNFNTTNGKSFSMRNTTVEDIKAELSKRFPNWSNETIEKIISNKAYYSYIIPVEKPKAKRGSISKESITINGYELNPIFKLGQNIHMFQKHSYREWGNISKEFLNHPNISSKFNNFEKKYQEVVSAVKSDNKSKGIITLKVLEMCDLMMELKDAINHSGLLNTYKDSECVNGNGRRLGIGTLMDRVSNLTFECSNNLTVEAETESVTE